MTNNPYHPVVYLMLAVSPFVSMAICFWLATR